MMSVFSVEKAKLSEVKGLKSSEKIHKMQAKKTSDTRYIIII